MPNLIENTDRKYLIALSMLAMLGILLINHFWGFFGHFGFDDMSYAGLANSVLKGKFSLGDDHTNYRWVVIFLTAFSYKIFGINDHSSALMPMLCTLVMAWMVARCVADKWMAALSIFLFGLYSWTLFYADKIMPDIYVAFFYFLAIYIVYQQRKDGSRALTRGMLFAFSIFFAVLSKETILLTIPVFGYLLLTDVIQKRNGKFWMAALLSLGIIMSLYLCFIKIETGHFMQRYYAIKLQSYFNPCSYDQLPVSETIRRISSRLWLVFLGSGLFLLIIPALVALLSISFKNIVAISDAEYHFPVVFILTLLCCNFMSTSLTHYVPMCEDPRHYLFMVPIAAVAGAAGWGIFLKNPVRYSWMVAAFGLCFYAAYANNAENKLQIYLTVLVVCSLILSAAIIFPKYFSGTNNERANTMAWLFKGGMTLCIIIALLAQSRDSLLYAGKMGYRYQKELVKKNLRGKQENIIVLTNKVGRNYGPYQLGYDTSHVIFRSYEDIKNKEILQHRRVYLLVDGFTNMLSGKQWEDMPHYAQDTKRYKLIDNVNGAELYEISAEDVSTY